MQKVRLILVTTLIFIASSALIVTYMSNTAVETSEVMTFDCETPVHKPEVLTITCADGNMYLEKITWSNWKANGAQGRGLYTYNNCEPDCAQGIFHSVKVSIWLEGLEEYKGRHYLRNLNFETLDGSNLSPTMPNYYYWDLMDFTIHTKSDK